MYGLSKNIDLSFLLGAQLGQVCIGLNELILHFDKDILLTVTSECDYENIDGTIIRIDSYKKEATIICDMLGCIIKEVKSDVSGMLILKFSNMVTFTIYDDSKHYESYLIQCGGRRDIVV